jgi:hypothetical protein
MKTEKEQPKGCPDDCNLNHPFAVFARLNGIGRSTIYRLKKKGLPVIMTEVGPRINCKKGREYIFRKIPT